MTRLGLVLPAASAAALLAVTAASAAPSTRVSWSETAKVRGVPVMSFGVSAIHIGTSRWTATVTYRNLTKRTLAFSGDSFGLAFFPSSTITPTTKPEAFGVADTFSHKHPSKLAPGDSWSGVISGPGQPTVTGRAWARIVFGAFTNVPGSKLFIWITDHSLVLTLGAKSSGGSGLVI